ncbi:MAG: hypothetical protein R2705_19115 [Ilumatobacteraceae bacterium]
MTGINQTLLLAFSMLGVAAILGAGGLGQLLFRALGQQDVALAASSGLAFFILAVMLDRIAQPQGAGGGGLLSRIVQAWRARSQPELLLGQPGFDPTASVEASAPEPAEAADPSDTEGVIAVVASRERTSMGVMVAGAIIAGVATLLPWGKNAGLLTGYVRRADQDLAGQSFSGLSASGGSWFGIVVLAMALFVSACSVVVLTRPRTAGRWLAPDGAAFGSLAMLVASLSYFVTRPSTFVVDYSRGIGAYLAVLGAAIATIGSIAWVVAAPYAPRRPLKPRVTKTPVILGLFALVFAVVALFSSWTLDERSDAVISPELQAQMDEIVRQAKAGEIEGAVASTQIATLRASAAANDSIVLDGKTSSGAGLGLWTLAFIVLGAAGTAVAAGAAGLDDRRRWLGAVSAMGFGFGVVLLATGWVGSLARSSDANVTSGVGVLFAGIAGITCFVAGRGVAAGFERSHVYRELDLAAA